MAGRIFRPAILFAACCQLLLFHPSTLPLDLAPFDFAQDRRDRRQASTFAKAMVDRRGRHIVIARSSEGGENDVAISGIVASRHETASLRDGSQ